MISVIQIMPDNLKVTIITVCFNSEETIADTIKSVISQNYSNIEHIVVDGASNDKTLEIVRMFPDNEVLIVSEPDRGIYDAMNKGISLATGDIVGFLNADDFYADDNVIQEIVNVFSDSTIEACYSDLVYVDKDNINTVVRYWKSRHYRDGLFSKGWVPPHPTFFTRRELYDRLGDFDLTFPIAADFELMLRFIACNKVKTHYIPHVTVHMRLGGTSNKSIKNIIRQNIEIRKAIMKNGIKTSVGFYSCRVVDKLTQYVKKPKYDREY